MVGNTAMNEYEKAGGGADAQLSCQRNNLPACNMVFKLLLNQNTRQVTQAPLKQKKEERKER